MTGWGWVVLCSGLEWDEPSEVTGGLIPVGSGALEVEGGLVVRAAPDRSESSCGDGVCCGDAGVHGVAGGCGVVAQAEASWAARRNSAALAR